MEQGVFKVVRGETTGPHMVRDQKKFGKHCVITSVTAIKAACTCKLLWLPPDSPHDHGASWWLQLHPYHC